MEELSGKSAFITGGANGIGRAMAIAFAREGVCVAIADIDVGAAKRTAKELEAHGVRAVAVECDVTSDDSFSKAANEAEEALGPIQILLNNAGAFFVRPLEETSRRDWEWLLEVNVLGVVNGLHTFLPRMRALAEPTHIVNTASVSGHIPTRGLAVYSATKYAVVGLSECLRLELEGSQIGLSILCPGIVRTGLLDSSREHRPDRHGGRVASEGPEMSAIIEGGSDPMDVGEKVVAGVRRGEFYILTHPDLRPSFQRRFDEIMAAYPE